MTVQKKAALTPHQRWALLRLEMVQRLSGTDFQGESVVKWASVKDTGSKGAMDHLVAKDYAARRVERGERGGYHYYYALTHLGVAESARIRERGLKVGGR